MEVHWDETSHTVRINDKNKNHQTEKLENPYHYPQLPKKVTSPEMLLKAYFGALFGANNLTKEQLGAAGGTLAMGKEPYPSAYRYGVRPYIWEEK